MGPLLGRWNLFLEKNYPLRSVGGTVSLKSLGKRVLVDQTLMYVLFGYSYALFTIDFSVTTPGRQLG